MPQKFSCDCPFTSALDVLGDKWMLVIVKLLLVDDKETFKDLRESDEGIASNVISSKLKLLEEAGIIIKTKRPHNKKTSLYILTDKGLALTPILVELANWSDNFLREVHPTIQNGPGMELLRQDKAAFAKALEDTYRAKLASMTFLKDQS
ncbi:MAG: helix-turn-helix domain-containing protein [Bacteroidota bacterium]